MRTAWQDRDMTLHGPIEGGARGYPFSMPSDDMVPAGTVIEEDFLAGTASGYDIDAGTEQGIDGKWSIHPTRTAPFRTRMLVVRPADAATFNGTVIVDWLNVTAGFEIALIDPEALREGAAWVGVSAQRIGLE